MSDVAFLGWDGACDECGWPGAVPWPEDPRWAECESCCHVCAHPVAERARKHAERSVTLQRWLDEAAAMLRSEDVYDPSDLLARIDGGVVIA